MQNSYYTDHKYCNDLSPYYGDKPNGDIDLEQVMGIWYGVEKIPHMNEEYKIERTRDCFYIDIKEVDIVPTPPPPYGYGDRSNYNYNYDNYKNPSYITPSPFAHQRPFGYQEPYRVRNFILEWHEGIRQYDYHIKVNTSHAGFWPTDLPNYSVEEQYRFFGGVIQVLKASHNHLVLNFCMRLPHSEMFSVVLSRNENQLTFEDLSHIHNVFTTKHLSTSSLQRVCDNGSGMQLPSLFLLALWFLVWRSYTS
ncbi:hypothetical protein O0L34_g12329 [Tuta absoluta]|nr:hypothetical protein O0L34_g12329 [Tuta absoluta]